MRHSFKSQCFHSDNNSVQNDSVVIRGFHLVQSSLGFKAVSHGSTLAVYAGLERFGVKLADASKLFGKKFAAGASITKSPTEQEQIEVQGDFRDKAAELIVKQYGKDHGIKKSHIFVIENKKKEPFFDEESDDE